MVSCRVSFNEKTGSLVINFGIRGRDIKSLDSDALVIVTIVDGKIADIEILFDNERVIKELSKIMKR